MTTPADTLFQSILRVAKLRNKPTFSSAGLKLEWDMQNLQLKGTFTIPLKTEIDAPNGKYLITAADFTEPEQTIEGQIDS